MTNPESRRPANVHIRSNRAQQLVEIKVDGCGEFVLTPEQALDVARHLQIQAGFTKPSLMEGYV